MKNIEEAIGLKGREPGRNSWFANDKGGISGRGMFVVAVGVAGMLATQNSCSRQGAEVGVSIATLDSKKVEKISDEQATLQLRNCQPEDMLISVKQDQVGENLSKLVMCRVGEHAFRIKSPAE